MEKGDPPPFPAVIKYDNALQSVRPSRPPERATLVAVLEAGFVGATRFLHSGFWRRTSGTLILRGGLASSGSASP